ncbi:MAG: hypothetical protein MJ033_05015 [Victivallaceae bacterium]|nr:hypothetical protein [Victivallaceae bacterium]
MRRCNRIGLQSDTKRQYAICLVNAYCRLLFKHRAAGAKKSVTKWDLWEEWEL